MYEVIDRDPGFGLCWYGRRKRDRSGVWHHPHISVAVAEIQTTMPDLPGEASLERSTPAPW